MQNRFSDIFLSKGVDYYNADKPLQEIINHFSFQRYKGLSDLGRYVSSELIESLDFIDHFAKPVLMTWSLMGERIDYVRISPDHARILGMLQKHGVVKSIEGNPADLMNHFLSGYLISDSGIFCTLTLTAQTAYTIQKYGNKDLKEKYLKKFFETDNPWYGATFYTEVQGGSDLGANRTIAMQEGEKFLLTGEDKYFASDSGIADGALVTARFKDSPSGAKGISLFFVPSHLEDGTPNYIIRRLKDKLGTTAVPTGEVEFDRSVAYQIGNEKNGIYLAMEALVISRIDDAIAAVGIARKALWEAYLYAEKRTAFGRRLVDHPLMQKDLLELETSLEASLVLSMLAADAFNKVSGVEPPYNSEYQLSRILGDIAKTISAEVSVQVTRYSMEILGGIGFLEEFPMAKFHRDSVVTSIWEGTSNIQSLEVMEVLMKRNGTEIMKNYFQDRIGKIKDRIFGESLETKMTEVFTTVSKWFTSGNPEFYAKEALFLIGNLVAACEMELVGQDNPSGAFAITSRIFFGKTVLRDLPDSASMTRDFRILGWMSRNKSD